MRSGASDASEAHPLAPSEFMRCAPSVSAGTVLYDTCIQGLHTSEACVDTESTARRLSRLTSVSDVFDLTQSVSAGRRGSPGFQLPGSQVRVSQNSLLINGTRPPLRQCMRSSLDPPGRGRQRLRYLQRRLHQPPSTSRPDMSRLPPARTPSRDSRRDSTLPHALCITAHTSRSPRSHPRHVCVAGRRKHALYTYVQCLTSSMSFAPVKFLFFSFLGSFFSMAAVKE